MNWKQAICRNREALTAVIAGLIILAGGTTAKDTASLPRLSRLLRLTILRILRPAESALRRLIVILAAVRTTTARQAAGAAQTGAALPDFSTFGQSKALPAFRLIDPRKRFAESARRIGPQLGIPRISVPGFMEPIPAKPVSTDDVNAAAILRRIAALDHALNTLPRQARRLIRLTAKRAKVEPGPGRVGPIRPGHPPGYRKQSTEPVDDILRECHHLALDCGLKPP